MFKHFLASLFLLFFLTATALAESIRVDSLDDLPQPGENGFMAEGSDPVYYKNHADGYWLYISATERIEITRYVQTKPSMIYYIADIRFAPGHSLVIRSVNDQYPGNRELEPARLAAQVRAVYAQNTDYYQYRAKNDQYPGHVVRNGRVLYSRSLTKRYIRLPNLATMGLYPDGHAEVNEAYEKTAQEYVDDGAADVMAFGPILIRDGEIQDVAQGTYESKAPRSCLGWIEQGHFVGLLVEGRRKNSAGATLRTCAQLLYEQGCIGALNLDGGGTAAMLFMGESVQITARGQVADTIRPMADLLCAGFY